MFDVVKLMDGREGTVVDIYEKPGFPMGYDIELSSGVMDLVIVHIDEIDKVLAKAN